MPLGETKINDAIQTEKNAWFKKKITCSNYINFFFSQRDTKKIISKQNFIVGSIFAFVHFYKRKLELF